MRRLEREFELSGLQMLFYCTHIPEGHPWVRPNPCYTLIPYLIVVYLMEAKCPFQRANSSVQVHSALLMYQLESHKSRFDGLRQLIKQLETSGLPL